MRVTDNVIGAIGKCLEPVFDITDKWVNNESFLKIDNIVGQITITSLLFLAIIAFSLVIVFPVISLVYLLVISEAQFTRILYPHAVTANISKDITNEMRAWLAETCKYKWNFLDNTYLVYVKLDEVNNHVPLELHFMNEQDKSWFLIRWSDEIYKTNKG